MGFSHGSKSVLKVTDAAATLRDLSDYLSSDGLSRSTDTAETTTKGKTAKTYIPGLDDGTFSLEGNFDPTVDGWLDGLRRKETTFEYFPSGEGGSAGTNVKYAGACILTSYEITGDGGDVQKISAEFQISDSVTRTLI